MSKTFTVYLHISPSWKYYVGITSAKNVKNRWGKNGNGYKTQYFKRAIDKYGWDNFIHIIIRNNLDKKDAANLEKLLIEQLKSNKAKYGYNISNGGEQTFLGFHHTKEAKSKIAKRFAQAVDQYNLDGELVKSWESMRDAERDLNISASSIAKCCKGIYKTSKGFVWRYKNEAFGKYDLKKYSQKSRMLKVKQYSKEGVLLKIWDGIFIASKELNLGTSTISRCCKGQRKSYGGYVWRYENDNFNQYGN